MSNNRRPPFRVLAADASAALTHGERFVCGFPRLGRRLALIGLGLFTGASLAGTGVRTLDLGELLVVSRVGEKLDGRIALVGAEGLRRQDIAIALGSEEDFGNRGLERFGYLNGLRFHVAPSACSGADRSGQRGNGPPVAGPSPPVPCEGAQVRVSSIAPIPDVYLNFLVRLSWPGGVLVREYAALLGAPRQAEPAVARPPKQEASPTPPSTAARPPPTVTVQPNDTLWRVAEASLPANGINVQQQMLAILQENPHAFVAGNINGLVAGAKLRLPDAAATMNLSPQEAIDEAGRQNHAWRVSGSGGRLRIIDRAQDSAPDRPATKVAAETPAPAPVTEPAREVAGIADAPPEPPVADLLQEARRQVREQARQLQRRDGEIARLSSELAALRTSRKQERQDWTEELERWRIAALAGLVPMAGLIAVGLVALRRRQAARRSDAAEAPDCDFGGPIGDGQVKLNLAKAYIDVNNRAGAREVLEEVVAEGTDEERREAQTLLEQLADAPSRPAPP